MKSNDQLRQISPDEITRHLEKHWDDKVNVELAPLGSEVVVPEGWHGAGKTGDALVRFGSLFEPLAGTVLPATDFTEWLRIKGFSFENDTTIPSSMEAANVLESDQSHRGGTPIFRAVRDTGVPIIIEVYHGAKTDEMKLLSLIGNMNFADRSPEEVLEYKNIVCSLMMPFISTGTTRAKERMNLNKNVGKIRRIDDCAAVLTTIAGDIAVDQVKNVSLPGLEEIGVSVATTHSVPIAVFLAEKRGVPLLFRIGALSYGLGGTPSDLFYMLNTLAEMRPFGKFTSGDFGQIMSTGLEQYQQPYIGFYGDGSSRNETRFYYNGGGPIQAIMAKQYEQRGKPYHGKVAVLRASRVDNGPQNAGVIFHGKNLPSCIID